MGQKRTAVASCSSGAPAALGSGVAAVATCAWGQGGVSFSSLSAKAGGGFAGIGSSGATTSDFGNASSLGGVGSFDGTGSEERSTGEEDEICIHRVRAKLFRLETREELSQKSAATVESVGSKGDTDEASETAENGKADQRSESPATVTKVVEQIKCNETKVCRLEANDSEGDAKGDDRVDGGKVAATADDAAAPVETAPISASAIACNTGNFLHLIRLEHEVPSTGLALQKAVLSLGWMLALHQRAILVILSMDDASHHLHRPRPYAYIICIT